MTKCVVCTEQEIDVGLSRVLCYKCNQSFHVMSRLGMDDGTVVSWAAKRARLFERRRTKRSET